MELSKKYNSDLSKDKYGSVFTISQVINLFTKTLKKPNNYPRIVRRYLEYCITNEYPINELSFQFYQKGRPAYIHSAIKNFLAFAKEHNLSKVATDPDEDNLPPAANELVMGFIHDATHLRGDESKKTYINALNGYFRYLEKSNQPFNYHSASNYANVLLKKQRSPFTVNLHVSIINQLAKWVVKSRNKIHHEFTFDQLESLRDIDNIRRVPTASGYHKEALTEEERELLQHEIKGVFWKAVCCLMSYCGLRSVEITRLRIEDIDMEKSRIQVKGKGKYDYVGITLYNPCRPYIQDWMEQRTRMTGIGENGKSLLFPNPDGSGQSLKTDQIRYQIKKAMKACGIARKKLTTHSLRHTAAQVLIDKDLEAIYVQRQLRHSSLDTTNKYILKKRDEKYYQKSHPGFLDKK
ncbi:site-specific integrase [Catalinimonas sp. 4WD22]|uniref:tyrosine-type recombinase/integrase n=1 Tax=Catalinimonas locisalis TaxID=3133978 RepID=UPI0031010578